VRLPLVAGFYAPASPLAGVQRCLNLYSEAAQKDAPYPVTYLLTPGLRELAQADGGKWRALYLSGVGGFFGVCGPNVYHIAPNWVLTLLGTIPDGEHQVYFADNRLAVVLVDTSSRGWVIDPFTLSFQEIQGAGAFYGANRVRYVDTYFVFNRPNTNQWYISLSEVTPAMLTGGPVVDGTIVGGAGYANGTHVGVPLTGGTGEGAVAEITVAAGVVTDVFITIGGESYRTGDVLGASAADLGGAIATGTISAAGAAYTNGAYVAVPLTGGSGSGATADITVAGGVVTVVSIVAPGGSYEVGDVLSADAANIGGTGSGFTWTVSTVSNTGAGFTYTLTEVGSSAFDSLDIAAKTGASDDIVTLEVMHRDVWLFGARFSTEIWYNAGTPDFTFARMPGVYVEHGCAAQDSVACTDLFMAWLGKDKEGNMIAFMGENYTAKRISTYAIEAIWDSYEVTNDAIGAWYQQNGHTFWVLTFPTADRTWVFDLGESVAQGEPVWHERCWVDDFGDEHRIRPNSMAFAFSTIVVGDWQNGKLYAWDPDIYTDDSQRIVRKRGFAHLVADGNLVTYQRLEANIEPGNAPGLLTEDAPEVSLVWSDTRGQSWGDPIRAPVGSGGQYDTYTTFWQLGSARDRVFELFWDFPYKTSLTGAWIDAVPAKT
jgi:hypothetical protein